jgi:hypothetical protein
MQDTDKSILHRVNPNVHDNGQGEAMRRTYKRLELGGAHTYGRSANCSFSVVAQVKA